MNNIIILDLDGVLITTPSWKADDIHEDGYSAFSSKAVSHLNTLIQASDADLWLSSSRRKAKTLTEFRQIFKNRGIEGTLSGFLPLTESRKSRKEEVESFLNQMPINNFLILDDDASLEELPSDWKVFWIRTHYHVGFDQAKLEEALGLLQNWVK